MGLVGEILKKVVRLMKVFLLVALMGLMACSIQAVSPAVRATWGPPLTGSPVVVYDLEVHRALPDTLNTEPFFKVDVEDTTAVIGEDIFEGLVEYVARVRGIDALGRAGPWSWWSDPYMWDPGEPGQSRLVIWSLFRSKPSGPTHEWKIQTGGDGD